MRFLLEILYMFISHPILFFKYSIRKRSRGFFVKGTASKLHTRQLVVDTNVRFGDDTRIDFYSGGKLLVGKNCYFGNRNSFLVGADITIGYRVLMASNILIASEDHIALPETENVYDKLIQKPVEIGDRCWIGEKVCIMPGVKIGKYSVIGAASVVTKSVPPYSIAVGNPAKVIKKYNFDTHQWENITN